ncbi:helix-turn-helix domain-containing protein [Sphingobium sp. LMA1-1-1.1]|uniref:helix-turn-helix domain-containing protein n=1 Tax=Sphingobium sp. LMA1-1-1.1 TaxID=3135238 RepID=UPI00342C7D37
MQPITCSVDDAAKAIGIGRVTLYKYIKEGRVESVRIGGRRLVKIESVKRLVEAA